MSALRWHSRLCLQQRSKSLLLAQPASSRSQRRPRAGMVVPAAAAAAGAGAAGVQAHCAEAAARGLSSLAEGGSNVVPVQPVSKSGFEGWLGEQPEAVASWAAATGFKGGDGEVLLVPGAKVRLAPYCCTACSQLVSLVWRTVHRRHSRSPTPPFLLAGPAGAGGAGAGGPLRPLGLRRAAVQAAARPVRAAAGGGRRCLRAGLAPGCVGAFAQPAESGAPGREPTRAPTFICTALWPLERRSCMKLAASA